MKEGVGGIDQCEYFFGRGFSRFSLGLGGLDRIGLHCYERKERGRMK